MKVSIIVPTVDRPEELLRLLRSFETQTVLPHEIIVVDQGSGTTAEVIASFHSLPIIHIPVQFASLTKARNVGVQKATGDVIGFLDDDIILDPTYIESIPSFFETHPHALGVQGLITDFEAGHAKKVGGNKAVYWMYNIFAKVFLLNNSSTKNKLLLSGRNQYASRARDVINCEWLSGIGNYKKEVFITHQFDESLGGYALGEDKLFSYPIYEKHASSLFLDPAITCEHHHAESGRPKGREWVHMKIRNTHYVWTTLLKKKGVHAYAAFVWANIGDTIVVLLSALIGQQSFRFWWWHITGYMKLLFV